MEHDGHDGAMAPEAREQFSRLVISVGVKQFAHSLGVSTRQVNRMLSGAQPNPVDRLVRCLQAADPDAGDTVLDYICQEMGGRFMRGSLDDAAVNRVVERCSEALDAVAQRDSFDGQVNQLREAIVDLHRLIEGESGADGTDSTRATSEE